MTESDAAGAPTQAATETPDVPTVGGRFARRYLVERLVGRGGMGTVWAVQDVDLGERVALKTLDVAGGSAQTLERFRREVRLARRVTHKNVARIFDIGEAGTIHYLTMELVDGESLADRLSGSLPTVAEACRVALQIADGLASAHEVGIIHRDLKPGNILVERTGRVVITDFGIACAVTGDVRLTVEGAAFLGTPAYMSPEQVRGDPVDARSDLYALGVMVYELLTGRLPFHGDTAISLALARLHQRPADPREHAPTGDALATLVLDCLAVDPNGRPPGAADFASRLRALMPDAAAATGLGSPAASADAWSRACATTTGRTPGFASTRVGEQGVAVLPFRYRGVLGEEYLAEALTDEVIDLLSRNRALRVSARGATAKFGADVDPRQVGHELGVDVVVEGSVQRSPDAIRIQARLVAVDTGFQLWSERFDGRLVDVFDLQDRLATQIAETLRVQLETTSQRHEVPAEAVALYLRGRTTMRAFHMGGTGPDGAVGQFEQALAIAPTFRPAIAALAVATERTWFSPVTRDEISWRDRTEVAVRRALDEAGDVPDSHLAAARMQMQLAEYGDAARSIARAIALAPTFAGAHEVLGCLQCEAARVDEGLRHLGLAVRLDPTLITARMYQARHHEMHGRHEVADALFEEAEQHAGRFDMGLVTTRGRIAAWRGDLDEVVRQRARLPATASDGGSLLDLLFQGYLGIITLADAVGALRRYLHPDFGPRFTTLGLQLAVEGLAWTGDLDNSETLLAEAVDGPLVDLDWMDHCPALAPLRARRPFAALRQRVAVRAQKVWVAE